jgi:hypothetical protein
MVNSISRDNLSAITGWLNRTRSVNGAILFGSQVRESTDAACGDEWSDIDIHIIGRNVYSLAATEWGRVFHNNQVCLQVVRPASGGVRKLTLLLERGEIDMVLIPSHVLALAGIAMRMHLHQKLSLIRNPLNDLATIIGGGYRFLKGQPKWGALYSKILNLPGFRISDSDAVIRADTFLCDFVWVLKKIERRELVAAQRILHRNLLETNIVLLHELRLRRREPTFQQARRVEILLSPQELSVIRVNASLTLAGLRGGAWAALNGLRALMSQLVPSWRVPSQLMSLPIWHSSVV